MRKLFLSIVAAAALITSCSKDDTTSAPINQRSKVTFAVNAPELATRAGEGNGLQAKNLEYVIYDLAEDTSVEANLITGKTTFPDGSLTTTVEVDLVEGRTYEAIFFATADNAPYTFNKTAKTMTINTSGLTANNEAYDAFYKYVEPFTVAATGYEADVKMTRPFAQLNVATGDRDTQAGKMIDAKQTGVKVEAYKSLDLKTGDVIGEKDLINFELADDNLAGNITVAGQGYDWLTMNYILVNDRELVTVEFSFTDVTKTGDVTYTRNYDKVPVQRNHKTNIVGSILTNKTEFNVEILPGFETPDNNVFDSDVWDGTTQNTLEQAKDENNNPIYVDAEGNQVDENTAGALPLFEVTSAADLAGLMGNGVSNVQVANNNVMLQTRAGEQNSPIYIRLTSSIDLAGHNWTPIAFNDSENVGAATPFVGVFDGNDYTISNLKIHKTNRGGLGLFGAVAGTSTFKNITLENVDILSNDTNASHRSSGDTPSYPDYLSGGQIGALVGYNADNNSELTFEDVHVKGLIKIEGEQKYAQGQRIGGVFGGRLGLKSISFKNVTVKGSGDSYIKGFCSVGGVAGQLQGPATFENIQTDIEITANTFAAAGIVGIAQHSSAFTNCSAAGDIHRTATEDFDGKSLSAHSFFRVGGIVGCWSEAKDKNLTLTNCSFTGELYSNANTSKSIPAGAVTDGYISKFDYNGLVGRGWGLAQDGTSVVTIDGTNHYYVRNVGKTNGLQTALDNATATNNVIYLINTISESAHVDQKEGVNIIIDGAYNTYDGTIDIYGHARHTGAETLTFRNINFKHDDGAIDFISCNTTDSDKRYAHNVTVENCTFTGNSNGDVVGMRFRQCYNISVVNSTFANMHSLMWATGTTGITLDGVTVTNSKSGVSFGTSTNVVVKNSNITANTDYGIRADGSVETNLSVENSTINASVPIIVRKATKAYSVALDYNTDLKTTEMYHVVFTNGSDDEAYATPTGEWSITGAEGLNVYPTALTSGYNASSSEQLSQAIKAGATTVNLADGSYDMPTDISLQGKELTIIGSRDAVIDASKVDAKNQFVTGAALKFEGVTLNFGKSNYMGFANCASLTYKDCAINGLQFAYNPIVFDNCDFNSNGAEHCVWTYGAKEVTFNDCDFTYADRCVNVYLDNGTDSVKVDFSGCKFTNSDNETEGAVEINSSAFPKGANVNFTNCTAPSVGDMVFISKWDGTSGKTATVTVDGQTYNTPVHQ